MYAIGNIIYGIPLNDNDNDIEQPEILEVALEDEDPEGFMTFYTGSGDTIPSAFGIVLDGIDEACHHIDLATLKLVPTDAEQAQFEKLYNDLPQELKDAVDVYGKPRTFILWSTS